MRSSLKGRSHFEERKAPAPLISVVAAFLTLIVGGARKKSLLDSTGMIAASSHGRLLRHIRARSRVAVASP